MYSYSNVDPNVKELFGAMESVDVECDAREAHADRETVKILKWYLNHAVFSHGNGSQSPRNVLGESMYLYVSGEAPFVCLVDRAYVHLYLLTRVDTVAQPDTCCFMIVKKRDILNIIVDDLVQQVESSRLSDPIHNRVCFINVVWKELQLTQIAEQTLLSVWKGMLASPHNHAKNDTVETLGIGYKDVSEMAAMISKTPLDGVEGRIMQAIKKLSKAGWSTQEGTGKVGKPEFVELVGNVLVETFDAVNQLVVLEFIWLLGILHVESLEIGGGDRIHDRVVQKLRRQRGLNTRPTYHEDEWKNVTSERQSHRISVALEEAAHKSPMPDMILAV